MNGSGREKNFSRQLALLLALAAAAEFLPRALGKSGVPGADALGMSLAFAAGMLCILKTAPIIGFLAQTLKFRTGLAAGLLQSIGTAFPDMVIGILAALLSLKAAGDPKKSIQLAMIAGSTTFASNIYNILHASWCIWRQHEADRKQQSVPMFPWLGKGGVLTPSSRKRQKPTPDEIDACLSILTLLSMVTAFCALGLVLVGKVGDAHPAFAGDLYRFNKWQAGFVLICSLYLLYSFRKTHGNKLPQHSPRNPDRVPALYVWLWLAMGAIVLFISAHAVIGSILEITNRVGVPVAVAGSIAALVGCLGEMAVVHDFSVQPHGNIMDAVTGVAMDNFVTLVGACIIALMGGVYLGGDEAIIIFVCILLANTLLIFQTSKLKNVYL